MAKVYIAGFPGHVASGVRARRHHSRSPELLSFYAPLPPLSPCSHNYSKTACCPLTALRFNWPALTLYIRPTSTLGPVAFPHFTTYTSHTPCSLPSVLAPWPCHSRPGSAARSSVMHPTDTLQAFSTSRVAADLSKVTLIGRLGADPQKLTVRPEHQRRQDQG